MLVGFLQNYHGGLAGQLSLVVLEVKFLAYFQSPQLQAIFFHSIVCQSLLVQSSTPEQNKNYVIYKFGNPALPGN